MGQNQSKYIYIVDDDRLVRESTHLWLSLYGYSPRSFATPNEFLEQLPDLNPGCALVDVRMPNIDGIQLLEQYKSDLEHLTIIIMTGHADEAMRARAKELGAVNLIEKPYKQDELIAAIEKALSQLPEPPEVPEETNI